MTLALSAVCAASATTAQARQIYGTPGSPSATMNIKGDQREQFMHVIDVVPTILEVCGIKQPQYVDGKAVQPITMPHTMPMILQWDESFDIGSDTLTSVNDADYRPPFTLTAKLNKLTIKVDRLKLTPEDIRKLEGAEPQAVAGAPLRHGRDKYTCKSSLVVL